MAIKNSILIGQLLIDEELITLEQLESALERQLKTREFICTVLIKLGLVDKNKAFSCLSKQLNIPYVNLKSTDISSQSISRVSAKFASHYKIVPVSFEDNILTVAMTDPTDIRVLDDLGLVLGCQVKGVLAYEEDLIEAMKKFYGIGAETLEKMIGNDSGAVFAAVKPETDIENKTDDASVTKFVDQILNEAIKDRATDVHLEPYQDKIRVRFRVDGVLYDASMPVTIKYFYSAIVSRIKIMANLNIAERRLPQDGRFEMPVSGQNLDLRVSVLPSAFGEAVHIRVLSSRFFLDLEKLGLSSEDSGKISEVIESPHGIIFITGPTGSGKSTTLYACLNKLNRPDTKIITVEDPVEYQMPGIVQMQVHPKIGFTFAAGLRHILRHDPDVVMVGEVRDFETAEIAIRAALTGHLVFSTLHTNDAAGAVTRLLDMGVEPFLLASSAECLIAQRLVRLICTECKQVAVEQNVEAFELIEGAKIKGKLYEGKGCPVCRFTGYRGRTGIYEILPLTEPIRKLILSRASSQQIKQQAVSAGMRTLRQDGLLKVLAGVTTLSEVIRVTSIEDKDV
jgi:type IV pilus assembly protein PilB